MPPGLPRARTLWGDPLPCRALMGNPRVGPSSSPSVRAPHVARRETQKAQGEPQGTRQCFRGKPCPPPPRTVSPGPHSSPHTKPGLAVCDLLSPQCCARTPGLPSAGAHGDGAPGTAGVRGAPRASRLV